MISQINEDKRYQRGVVSTISTRCIGFVAVILIIASLLIPSPEIFYVAFPTATLFIPSIIYFFRNEYDY